LLWLLAARKKKLRPLLRLLRLLTPLLLRLLHRSPLRLLTLLLRLQTRPLLTLPLRLLRLPLRLLRLLPTLLRLLLLRLLRSNQSLDWKNRPAGRFFYVRVLRRWVR